MAAEHEISLSNFISKLILALTVFSYFDLFQFVFIPYKIRVVSSILMAAVLIIFILLRIIYMPDRHVKMNFSSFILLLIFGTVPAYFTAFYYHDQSFPISFYANRMVLFYLLYFFVHFYKVPVKFVLQLIVFTGLFVAVLFIVQYIMYPVKLMDIKAFVERGTIRMFVPGMICTIVSYFYFLNQFFEKHKISLMLLSLLCLSIFILQGTRSYIFTLFLLTMLYLLFTKRIKAKFLIMLVVSMAVVMVFFLFREIFTELTKVSNSQAGNISQNVRVKAAKFFLTDFMPGSWAYIFGNGSAAPGSSYFQKWIYYIIKYGYYITDIGVIGDYVKYGVLFTISGLIMLGKSLTFKVSPAYNFLKYYIVSQCFTLLTGYGILSGVDINIVLILYVFDVDRFESLNETLQNAENKLNPSNLLS